MHNEFYIFSQRAHTLRAVIDNKSEWIKRVLFEQMGKIHNAYGKQSTTINRNVNRQDVLFVSFLCTFVKDIICHWIASLEFINNNHNYIYNCIHTSYIMTIAQIRSLLCSPVQFTVSTWKVQDNDRERKLKPRSIYQSASTQ